jgi:hypothetical protein
VIGTVEVDAIAASESPLEQFELFPGEHGANYTSMLKHIVSGMHIRPEWANEAQLRRVLPLPALRYVRIVRAFYFQRKANFRDCTGDRTNLVRDSADSCAASQSRRALGLRFHAAGNKLAETPDWITKSALGLVDELSSSSSAGDLALVVYVIAVALVSGRVRISVT